MTDGREGKGREGKEGRKEGKEVINDGQKGRVEEEGVVQQWRW